MISPELLRRYPFFGGLDYDNIINLAKNAEVLNLEAEYFLFEEDDELNNFYLVLEGAVAIFFEVPERGVEHKLSEQFARQLRTRNIVVGSLGPGEVFGWSGMVSPFKATASAKTLTQARIVAFDCKELLQLFEEDCAFGYQILQRIAQVARDRLRNMRIESLTLVNASLL